MPQRLPRLRPGRCAALITVLHTAILLAPAARGQDKIEIFGGYSYLRAPIPVGQFGPLGPLTPCPPDCGVPPIVTQRTNLNGWEIAGAYHFAPFLSLAADFSGHYGSLNGGNTHLQTYLSGPQLSFPAKVSPFVHALFGGAKQSTDAFTSGQFYSLGHDTSFASALGAGIDVKIAPFLSWRVIQGDYLLTRFHGSSQNQPRASMGFVLRF